MSKEIPRYAAAVSNTVLASLFILQISPDESLNLFVGSTELDVIPAIPAKLMYRLCSNAFIRFSLLIVYLSALNKLQAQVFVIQESLPEFYIQQYGCIVHH